MIETYTLITQTKIDVHHMTDALLKLAPGGWTPALLESQKLLLCLAGVEQSFLLDPESPMMRPRYYRHRVGGDIFFRDKDVYFVLTKPNGDVYHGDDSNSQPMLEVGIISADRTNLEIRLRSFAQAIEQTLVSAQLSESESLTFAWKAKTIESPHLTKIINMAEDQGLRYSVAEYSAAEFTFEFC
jgi:hypothetical protein